MLEDIEYQLSLGPALASLEAKGHYRFTWKAVPPLQAQAQGEAADEFRLGTLSGLFRAFSIMCATLARLTFSVCLCGMPTVRTTPSGGVGGFSGAADRYIRALIYISPPGSTPRGLIQRCALILWGDTPTLPTPADQDAILTYDVVVYASEYDRVLLSSAVRHPNLQHACGIQAPTFPPPETCLPPSDAAVNFSSTTNEHSSPPSVCHISAASEGDHVVVLLGPAAAASPPLPFSSATSVSQWPASFLPVLLPPPRACSPYLHSRPWLAY